MNLSQLYPRTGPLQLWAMEPVRSRSPRQTETNWAVIVMYVWLDAQRLLSKKVITNMKYIFWTVLIRMTGTLITAESYNRKQIILISILLTGRLQMEYTDIRRGFGDLQMSIISKSVTIWKLRELMADISWALVSVILNPEILYLVYAKGKIISIWWRIQNVLHLFPVK